MHIIYYNCVCSGRHQHVRAMCKPQRLLHDHSAPIRNRTNSWLKMKLIIIISIVFSIHACTNFCPHINFWEFEIDLLLELNNYIHNVVGVRVEVSCGSYRVGHVGVLPS